MIAEIFNAATTGIAKGLVIMACWIYITRGERRK